MVTALALVVAALGPACESVRRQREARAAQEHVHRADLALARGQPQSAEAEYRAALALRDASAEAWLGLARAQSAQGRDVEALATYDALGERDPERLEAVLGTEVCPLLARTAEDRLAAGDAEAGLALARRAQREGCTAPEPGPVLAHALSARAEAVRATDPAEAADLYVAAAAADPDASGAFARAAALLLGLGRREDAQILLSEALRLHPHDADLQTLMVDALARRPPTLDPFATPESRADDP